MSYNLTQKYRLVARTTPELYYALNELVSRYAAKDEVSFRGRKLGVEAVFNAICLHWLGLSDEERLRIVREGVTQFERLLEGDESAVPGNRGATKKGAPEGAKEAKDVGPVRLKAGFEVPGGGSPPPPHRKGSARKSRPNRGTRSG